MPALIIGKVQREQIAELKAVAAAKPFDPVKTQETANNDMRAFRNAMRPMSIVIPVGYHVTYTQEIQPNAPPPGLFHHISISVDRPFEMPHEEAVELILKEFGMASLSQSAFVWVEDVSMAHRAINVLQLCVEAANA